jgi:hypothetical protein
MRRSRLLTIINRLVKYDFSVSFGVLPPLESCSSQSRMLYLSNYARHRISSEAKTTTMHFAKDKETAKMESSTGKMMHSRLEEN